jgi:hypothetical protein
MESLKSDGMDYVDHFERRHPCGLSVGEVTELYKAGPALMAAFHPLRT